MSPKVDGNSVASGLLLVGIAAFMAYSGRNLPLYNSGGNMGPGYFPTVLSGILAALGVAVVLSGWREAPLAGESAGAVERQVTPWRGIILVTAALLAFATSIRPLGLGPSLASAVFIASLASRHWRLLPALTITALMVAAAWGIFIKLLGMPVAFLGPLLR